MDSKPKVRKLGLDGHASGIAVDIALVHMVESPNVDDEGLIKVSGGGFDLDEEKQRQWLDG